MGKFLSILGILRKTNAFFEVRQEIFCKFRLIFFRCSLVRNEFWVEKLEIYETPEIGSYEKE
jgi:hypothetical protein